MKISRAIDNIAVRLKKNLTWPGRTRVGRCKISYKRSVKFSPRGGGRVVSCTRDYINGA